MRSWFLSFVVIAACFLPGTAQVFDPVKWEFSQKEVDGNFELIFKATIQDGWAIYSQFIDEGGPIPTSFTFDEGEHFALDGKTAESENAKKGYDGIFEMEMIKFYKYAEFKQKVKVSDFGKPVTGYLTFMTCDDERCLPPTDVDFEFKLKPSAAGASSGGSASTGAAGGGATEFTQQEEQQTGQQKISKQSESEKPAQPNPAGISEVEDKVDQSEQKTEAIGSIDIAGIDAIADIEDEKESGLLKPVKWSYTSDVKGDDLVEVTFRADIDKGWHIYPTKLESDDGPIPTGFYFDEDKGFELAGEIRESSPKVKKGYNQVFDMRLVSFSESATFSQDVRVSDLSAAITGALEFMVCDETKCLNPEFIDFKIVPGSQGALSGAILEEPTNGLSIAGNVVDQVIPSIQMTYESPVGECGEEETARNQSLLWTFVLGFLGGLLALLTPCVFPMIPLTVSFFSKDTKRSGWMNGVLYGLSIVVIYVTIGLLITALFGATALNALSTNWIANTIFFLIFVAFAFSFFGFYEIQLPASWANRSDSLADKGGLIGIFFMAFTLALVSFSCTGPIIGTAIVQSATNATGPFIVMLGFSMALALPFGLFAAFPAWLNTLPRSGSWMNSVKVILGFLELALAFKFLSVADMTSHWNFLKYELFLGLWVIIAVGMALYLFGFIKFPHDSPIKKLSIPRMGLAVAMSALSLYLVTGFFQNERTQTYNALPMLSGLAPPAHYNFFSPGKPTIWKLTARWTSAIT